VSLPFIILVIIPGFMVLASVLLYWQRRASAHQVNPSSSLPIEPEPPKKEASASEIAALQEALVETRRQLEGIPDRTAGMSDMIARLTATVNQLKSDMQNEQLEKSQLRADLENTRALATQATAMMTLVEQKEHGATWSERMTAELKLTGGYCTDVALRIGRELETSVKELYLSLTSHPQSQVPFLAEMMKRLTSDGHISKSNANIVFNAWRIRNALAHEARTKATAKEGEIMIEALAIIENHVRKALD